MKIILNKSSEENGRMKPQPQCHKICITCKPTTIKTSLLVKDFH